MKRSNPGEPSDPIDRLLFELPQEPAPPDLAARIYKNIRVHYKRQVAFQFGISLLLTVAGIWLAWPGLADILQSLALPENGLAVVSALIEMAEAGATRMSAEMISAVTAFQSHLSNPLNGIAWIGMIVLAGGCLLALDQMLPHHEDF